MLGNRKIGTRVDELIHPSRGDRAPTIEPMLPLSADQVINTLAELCKLLTAGNIRGSRRGVGFHREFLLVGQLHRGRLVEYVRLALQSLDQRRGRFLLCGDLLNRTPRAVYVFLELDLVLDDRVQLRPRVMQLGDLALV